GQRRVLRGHGEHVAGGVVAERDHVTGGGAEGDVVPVRDAVGAVVLVPAAPVGNLHLVAAGGQGVRGPLVGPVPVTVVQPGGHAPGLPVLSTADLALEAARQGDDLPLRGAAEPVRGRVVEEGDRPTVMLVGDVVPVQHATGTVTLLPAAADGHLVLVVPGGQVEGGRVDAVLAECQRCCGTVGLPVPGAPHLGVVAAGDGDQLLGGLLGRTAVHRLPDHADGGRGHPVPGGVLGDGPVLHHRAGGQRAHVVEHPGCVASGGAQRRPVVLAEQPVGEGGLRPGVRGDLGADRGQVVKGAALPRGEGDAAWFSRGGHGAVGHQHDGGQRRDIERHLALGVRGDRGVVTVQGGVVRSRGESGQGGGHRLGGAVQRDQVLHLLVAGHAGEGVQRTVGGQLDLGTAAQRLVLLAQLGQLGDVGVHRRVGVVVVDGADRLTGQPLVLLVLAHLAGEQVLPGVLVPALADEALLVAVVDHRLPAGEVHQRVRQLGALQLLAG